MEWKYVFIIDAKLGLVSALLHFTSEHILFSLLYTRSDYQQLAW